MNNIIRVFKRLRAMPSNELCSDFILFGRAVAGKRYTMTSIRKAMLKCVPVSDYPDMGEIIAARHFKALRLSVKHEENGAS